MICRERSSIPTVHWSRFVLGTNSFNETKLPNTSGGLFSGTLFVCCWSSSWFWDFDLIAVCLVFLIEFVSFSFFDSLETLLSGSWFASILLVSWLEARTTIGSTAFRGPLFLIKNSNSWLNALENWHFVRLNMIWFSIHRWFPILLKGPELHFLCYWICCFKFFICALKLILKIIW